MFTVFELRAQSAATGGDSCSPFMNTSDEGLEIDRLPDKARADRVRLCRLGSLLVPDLKEGKDIPVGIHELEAP